MHYTILAYIIIIDIYEYFWRESHILHNCQSCLERVDQRKKKIQKYQAHINKNSNTYAVRIGVSY